MVYLVRFLFLLQRKMAKCVKIGLFPKLQINFSQIPADRFYSSLGELMCSRPSIRPYFQNHPSVFQKKSYDEISEFFFDFWHFGQLFHCFGRYFYVIIPSDDNFVAIECT